ncbi:phage holin family protein [Chitinimonas sp. PSY-7]|uniref:phage holin family protein n=1 Tax=Chitinimonas sp. PSY-7 TaxID=3459088 RepID=UPI0040401B8B
MTYFVWVYALLCGVIAIRLLGFRRTKEQYSPRVAWLVYVLVVATGSVPLRVLHGEPVSIDISSFATACVLALAVCATRGNLADLFGSGKSHQQHPITRFLRKHDDA